MIDVINLPSQEAQDVTTIYAIADIHGRLDLLEKMESIIADDIARYPLACPLICYLGDYIDRGPQSAQVIDRLCRPFKDGVPRIFLKGNHEDRMIDFLGDPAKNGPSWIKFGGREAMESYGLDVPEYLDESGWTTLRDNLSDVLPAQHRYFLKTLRLVWSGETICWFMPVSILTNRPMRNLPMI